MKTFTLCFLLFSSYTLYSQWGIGNYVDESGRETGETFLFLEVEGLRKSPGYNTPCIFDIEYNKFEKFFSITIYANNNDVPVYWPADTFQDFLVENDAKELVRIESFCLDGMIYFEGLEYEQLMQAIEKGGNYKMTCNYEYGEESCAYVFDMRY